MIEGQRMSKIMVIAKFRLNNENLLENWKTISKKIDSDLAKADGFISRDSLQGEDGMIYCVLKWESKSKQEKFMEDIMSRTDEESQAIMTEFEHVANMETMNKEFLEVL